MARNKLILVDRDPQGRFRPIEVEVRLWSKVAGPWNTRDVGVDDCWYFAGKARNRWGYPRVWWPHAEGRLVIGAHVLAYVITHGEVPAGLVVCHRCHHKCCCNPAHLFADTQSSNVRQAWQQRRASAA